MNILKIITSVFVLLVLAIGIWFGLTQATNTKDIAEDGVKSLVFKDENQMRLKAVFDPRANVAIISFEEFKNIELTRVESEEGEIYENQDYNVVLLNQEGDATLYYKDEIIFTSLK